MNHETVWFVKGVELRWCFSLPEGDHRHEGGWFHRFSRFFPANVGGPGLFLLSYSQYSKSTETFHKGSSPWGRSMCLEPAEWSLSTPSSIHVGHIHRPPSNWVCRCLFCFSKNQKSWWIQPTLWQCWCGNDDNARGFRGTPDTLVWDKLNSYLWISFHPIEPV